ncbi:ABC transporter substrate-binding protein [Romboutsia sp.]|uniref:ABC transporter substrate-binding protein n=1 Tax=Romboutsia sp. TaxID=1965302 RepID=UPI003F383A0D
MNKSLSLRRFLIVLAIAGISLSVVGCSSKEDNKDNAKPETKIESSNFKPVQFVYSDGANEYEVKVEKPSEKAVTLSQFMTEMLLALGLEDRMVGTALLDNPILPEYKKAYEKIPELKIAEGHSISKEAFMATGADFVSGWDMSITEQTTGAPDELIQNGITPFACKSLAGDATVETVYEDFMLLGKIFGVEDKATEVVNKMKSDIKAVQDKLGQVKDEDRVKMMVYDAGENDAIAVGSGLPNNLISLAGGNNIFSDQKEAYVQVSWESIVSKNPEVIIVTDYMAGSKPEEKIEFLKNHPALKNVDAIKNNRIYVVGLADLSPGVRNAQVIEKMYGYFYGENK